MSLAVDWQHGKRLVPLLNKDNKPSCSANDLLVLAAQTAARAAFSVDGPHQGTTALSSMAVEIRNTFIGKNDLEFNG